MNVVTFLSQLPTSELYEVKHEEKKGYMVVAKQNIEPGKKIFEESVFLTNNAPIETFNGYLELANLICDDLAFMTLSADRPLPENYAKEIEALPETIQTAFKIAYTNAFNTGWIGLTTSLFNHCCFPNAVMFKVGHVFVTKHIKPGEEICINYLDDLRLQNMEERRKSMQHLRAWICQCWYCNNPGNLVDSQLMCGERKLSKSTKIELSTITSLPVAKMSATMWMQLGAMLLEKHKLPKTNWRHVTFLEQSTQSEDKIVMTMALDALATIYEEILPKNDIRLYIVARPLTVNGVMTRVNLASKSKKTVEFYEDLERRC